MIVNEFADITSAIADEIQPLLVRGLKENARLAFQSVPGMAIQHVKDLVKNDVPPDLLREHLRTVSQDRFVSFEPVDRYLPFRQYHFYELQESETSVFRLHVVLRRPGMIPALVQATATKIRTTMANVDVDDVTTVHFGPLAMCGIYQTPVEDTFLEYIRAHVGQVLAEEHIHAEHSSLDSKYSFTCRRVG